MVKYEVSGIPNANAQIIRGDFLPGSIPVNIPDDEPLKTKYVSLFLHLKDLETGLECLQRVYNAPDEYTVYSLFMAALIQLIRCFRNNQARISLNENTFKKNYPEISQDYNRFVDMRNERFAHDEKGLSDAIGFLLVAPENVGMSLGGRVSVVWRDVPIDYLTEAASLEKVLLAARSYAINEIDSIADILFQKYSGKPREELLSYGIRGVSINSPEELTVELIANMRPEESNSFCLSKGEQK